MRAYLCIKRIVNITYIAIFSQTHVVICTKYSAIEFCIFLLPRAGKIILLCNRFSRWKAIILGNRCFTPVEIILLNFSSAILCSCRRFFFLLLLFFSFFFFFYRLIYVYYNSRQNIGKTFSTSHRYIDLSFLYIYHSTFFRCDIQTFIQNILKNFHNANESVDRHWSAIYS